MRKLLLVGTALGALSFAMPAFAGGSYGGHGGNPPPKPQNPTLELSLVAALAGNDGTVAGNTATTQSQSISTNISAGSFNGAKGMTNVNQNAGANSALQNALSVSYIQGCDCASTPTYTVAAGGALAAAGNTGSVESNSSTAERAIVGYQGGGWPHYDSLGGGGSQFTPIYGSDNWVTANIDASFNGVNGVFQVNQNSGDNSLLQNSAAVTSASQLKGVTDVGGSIALAGNSGAVFGSGNSAYADHTHASASISNSFNGSNGEMNVNQNVGANSLLQNASAIASLQFCNCATDNISLAVAAAGNDGSVLGNRAELSNGSNGVSMTNSFAGAQGLINVSQNAGANSLLQNAVSVGSVTH